MDFEEKKDYFKRFEKARAKLVRDNPGLWVGQIEKFENKAGVVTQTGWKNWTPIAMPVVDRVIIETFMVIGGEAVGDRQIFGIDQEPLIKILKGSIKARRGEVKYWVVKEVSRNQKEEIIIKAKFLAKER
ncbi:MAG: hypothetical protein WC686_01095 [Candidatus Shapirobacteria bacterium]|jgi:hypothetical protein